MKASLLSAAAASALVAAPARSAIIVVVNQAQFDAAIAVATQPGHTDTIDATGATGVIDAGTTLTLPGAATTITLELNSFSIGAQVGNGTMTMDGGTAVTFGQGSSSSPELNIGDVYTGVLNINGGSVTLDILTQSAPINVGSYGGTGTINMTSGSLTIDDSNASPGQYGALVIGYPATGTAAPTNGTFNQSGGTVSLSAGALDIGATNYGPGTTTPVNGTYNLSGNALLELDNGTVYLAQGSGAIGNINVSGNATFDFESIGTGGQIYVGSQLGLGTITQNGAGSTVILNVADIADFGSNVSGTASPAGTGTYNLIAGTLDIGTSPGAAVGGATFGADTAGVGILNQSGGTLVATAPVVIGFAGTGTYNLSGGTASFSDGLTIGEVAGGAGTVNQTAGTLTISAGSLTIGGAGSATYNLDGGVLQAGGVNGIAGGGALQLAGGTLQVIGSSLNSSIDIGLTGTASVIDTNGFGAALSGVIFGSGGFTKVGSGTLALSGANTYLGGTTLSDGTIQVDVDTVGAPGELPSSAIGTGTLTFDGGTLQAGGAGYTIVNAGVIDAPGGTIDANGETFTYSGSLTGSGPTDALSIMSSEAGGVVILSGTNTYSGATFVNSGTLEAGSTTAFSPNSTFVLANGATLALEGNDVTIASLLDNSSGGDTVENGSDLDATLTLPAASGTTTFSGVFADGGSGTFGLSKTGDSVLILTGASTYTGATSVTGGVLEVDGSLGDTAVTIGNGTALAGTGYIAGGVTIASGGALLPGGGAPGTITLGALTLSPGSLLDYRFGEANVAGGSSNALTNVTGALTINGGMLDVNNSGSFGLGVYQIFTYGTLAGDGQISIAALPDGDTGVIQTAVPGQVNLVVNGPGTLVQFWDGATLTGDGTIHGGSGTWNTAASNWTTPNGALNASWQGGFAVFAGTAGTVSVAGPLTYQGLQFLTSGYVLGGSGTLAPQGQVPIRVAAGATATIATAIVGTGGVQLTDPGTLILTGANTYSGGTLVNAGTLGVGSNAALGSGAVTLVGTTLEAEANGLSLANDFELGTGGGTIDTQADTLTLAGVIGGTTALTKTGSGTFILSGANTWSGGTIITSGTVELGTGGSLAADGALNVDAGATFDLNGHAQSVGDFNGAGFVTLGSATLTADTSIADSFSGVISGTGGLVKSGASTLTLSGANTYSGGTAVDAGTLAVGSNTALGSGALTLHQATALAFAASGLSLANAIELPDADPTIDTGANADTISGVISGIGGLTKIGTGTLILTGVDTYTGATEVAGGVLDVQGSLGDSVVTVAPGATLDGSGTVGSMAVDAGGVLAPGFAVPFTRLSVANGISFAAGSLYQVNVNAAGATDSVAAGGVATLKGGTVEVNAVPGAYAPSTVYTILTASGGVSGNFAGVTSSLAFLTPTLTYQADDVLLTLTLAVSPLNFASLGVTPNEEAVARTAEKLASGNAVFDAILHLTAPQALSAFNALSGEIHASSVSSVFEDSRLPRDAILDRLDSVTASTAPANADWDGDVTLWGQGFGSLGKVGSNGNAATLDQSLAGLMIGADTNPDPASSAGAVFGYTNSWLSLDQRASSGSIESVFGGLYGGTSLGAVQLGGGAVYAANDYNLSRSVVFPGFSNQVMSSYDGDTAQAFAEAGYRMDVDSVSVEPFADLLAMQIHTDSFTENGGDAALAGASRSYDYGATTLGMKGEMPVLVETPLIVTGSLGWRHVYGEIAPDADLAFESASQSPFTVAGAPIARNSLVAEAGIAAHLTDHATAGLFYSGDIARSTYDNVIKAKIEITF